MRVKGIVEEDFVNYRVPSMFITSCFCDFKCCLESGLDVGVCQNAPLVQTETLDVPDEVIYQHYADNPISKAVVVGGMEPFLQFSELKALIALFREHNNLADFVIYTGYYPYEITEQLRELKPFGNIVVKFGRFVPDRPHRFDSILGIELSSDNQFAMRIA